MLRERVIWITGLSASGKTTLGLKVVDKLRETSKNVVFFDGDEIRAVLGETSTYSRDDRLRLAYTYGRLCRMLSEQGITVVIATVALFKEIHEWNRTNIPGYIEVFLEVPIIELRRRDPKGIYKNYDLGLIKNIAGIDVPVDFPSNPDITFRFADSLHIDTMASNVVLLANSDLFLDGANT